MTARPISLVLDPGEEVAGVLGRIEDWLLFCETDTPESDATVCGGAQVAGMMAAALSDAVPKATHLYAPDGRGDLAPLLVVPANLDVAVTAIREAIEAVPESRPPDGTDRALDLLERSARNCHRPDLVALLAVATGRESVSLSPAQLRAYVRFVTAVVIDPLDRFIALPADATVRPVDDHEPATGVEM